MVFRLQIFLPANVLYKTIEIEASSVLEAKEKANGIFKMEFEKTGHKSGNFIIEQIR